MIDNVTETESYLTVADLGEFGVVSRIIGRLAVAAAPGVVVGPGDDAAVLRLRGDLVATVDQFVEGEHFRRDWSAPRAVGAKAAVRSLADLAAMGAVPVALLVAVALPEDTSLDWVDGLADGLAVECAAAGAGVVGGDVCSAPRIALSVTGLGDMHGRSPVTRSGAAPGELVALCGRTGLSAAGLAALTAGRAADPALAEVVAAHRTPTLDYGAGARLAAAGATAMIDVSDGLLADLGHLARGSGVRIDLSAAGCAPAEPVRSAAALLGGDALTWVLTGGEDHALVATLSDAALERARTGGVDLTVVGRVLAGSPAVTLDGCEPAGPGGWRHF